MVKSKRSRQVHHLVKTTHTYLGLLNFSHLIIFGIAGLVATFSPSPAHRQPEAAAVRYESFTVPDGLSDKAVADLVYAALDYPLSGPVPEWAIRRDDEGNLRLNFYSPNGPAQVTVLEAAHQLRVEIRRNGIWHYISNLHATVAVYENSGDWRLALWTYYIEFALWSFSLMALSGLYLWLYARPHYRLAVGAGAGGALIFILLYVLTR